MTAAGNKLRFLNIRDTAARLGKSRDAVAMLIQEGRLPILHIATDPGKIRDTPRIPANVAIDSGPWSPDAFTLNLPPTTRETCRPLLTTKDVAEIFGCGPAHVANLILADRLEAFDLSSGHGIRRRACYRMTGPGVNRFIVANLTA